MNQLQQLKAGDWVTAVDTSGNGITVGNVYKVTRVRSNGYDRLAYLEGQDVAFYTWRFKIITPKTNAKKET